MPSTREALEHAGGAGLERPHARGGDADLVADHLGTLVVTDLEDPLGDVGERRAVDGGQLR